MPRSLSLMVFVSGWAFAGEPVFEPGPLPPPTPVAPPTTLWDEGWHWFAGGTGGYLLDAEEGFYSGHIGAEWTHGGSSHALYLEVGFAEYEERFYSDFLVPEPLGEGGDFFRTRLDIDIEIIPVTLNYKYEFSLFGNCDLYLGGGAGIAFTNVDVSVRTGEFRDFGDDEDDTVFFGQVFAGLSFDMSEQFEIYGGARWVYLDGVATGFGDTDSEDDVVLEGGVRFHF